MLADEDLGERVAPLVEELADAEEELRLARERRRAPGGERRLRGLDGGVDLLDRGEVDRAGLRSGRGVEDRTAATGRAVDATPADPVGDARDRGSFDGLGHDDDPRGDVRPRRAAAGGTQPRHAARAAARADHAGRAPLPPDPLRHPARRRRRRGDSRSAASSGSRWRSRSPTSARARRGRSRSRSSARGTAAR